MCDKCWKHQLAGFHLCEWRVRYFNTLKSRNKDIESLKREIRKLKKVKA